MFLETDSSEAEIELKAADEKRPDVFKLNLRGTGFTAYSKTLCEGFGKGSIFDKMFDGRFKNYVIMDGTYFFERDPTHFPTIHTYLSQGRALLPTNPRDSFLLLEEAKFYGVETLVKLLMSKWPTCSKCKVSCVDEIIPEECSESHHANEAKTFYVSDEKVTPRTLTVADLNGMLPGTVCDVLVAKRPWKRYVKWNGHPNDYIVALDDTNNNICISSSLIFEVAGTHTKGTWKIMDCRIKSRYRETVCYPCCEGIGINATPCSKTHSWSDGQFSVKDIPKYN